MQVYKNFNNISQELKDTIPQLKEGEVKLINMLTGVRFLNVNEDGSEYWTEVFGKHQIPTRDRIKDPFFKRGGSTPEYVQIGVPTEVDPTSEVVIATKLLMPGMGEFQFNGKFSLTGGNLEDEEMFEYLWLCNYNGSNPYRDASIAPMFEFVDITKKSKETRRRTNDKLSALEIATGLGIDEVKDFHSAMGWQIIDDNEILRANIEAYADEFYDEFLKRYTDPNTKVRSEVQRASDAGFIKYDAAGHKVLWAKSNVVVMKLERVEGKTWVEQAAEFALTAGAQGTNFRKHIQKMLKDLYAPKKEEAITE